MGLSARSRPKNSDCCLRRITTKAPKQEMFETKFAPPSNQAPRNGTTQRAPFSECTWIANIFQAQDIPWGRVIGLANAARDCPSTE